MKVGFFTVSVLLITIFCDAQEVKEICGIKESYVLNKEMYYLGGYNYKIGDHKFRYNDRLTMCFLKETGNEQMLREIKKIGRFRISSNILFPIGIGALIIGGLHAAGGNVPTILIAGVVTFGASITLRVVKKKKLKKLPTMYSPYKGD